MDRCRILNNISMLGSRERENTRNACPIKYIRDGRQVKGIIAFIDVGTVDPIRNKHASLCLLSAVGKMCAKPKRSFAGDYRPEDKRPHLPGDN